MIAFIRDHKDHSVPGLDGEVGLRWGVEPMCAVLTEHGVPISPSTCYEWAARKPTKQQLRDEQVSVVIAAFRDRNKLNAGLGSDQTWIRLRGEGHDFARCTIEWLMRDNGWEGARYGRKHKTTLADQAHPRSPDLVDRNFAPAAPNRLWVADFSYVPTWTGMVYVAFVIDAFARRIIGRRAAKSMKTALVLDALKHAIFTRSQQGVTDLTGLVAHSDAGSVYTSMGLLHG